MRLLLHACCAPCSAPILEYLDKQGIKPTIYYFNPNIYPLDEFYKRHDELVAYCKKLGVDFIDGENDHERWRQAIAGLEDKKERGPRCWECFRFRLMETARKAAELGFDTIASTLSSSRWKTLWQIDEAGLLASEAYPSVTYLAKNWRKDGLQARRYELIEENNFYNQTYCGCEYSYSYPNPDGTAPTKTPVICPAKP